MTTVKIPYPARRKYTWAYPNEVHSYEQARDLFARMRRQSPEDDNPSRFQALTIALEALAHLSHYQGVDIFPGPKLHKLLCKSALAADWCPDLGAKQRAACAQPVDGGDSSQYAQYAQYAHPTHSLYRCPKCQQVKPLTEFLKPVTDAQRERWGWTNAHSARTTKAKTCRDCRHKEHQRSTRQSARDEAKRTIIAFEKAVADGVLSTATQDPEMLALVADYWQALFTKSISATRTAYSNASVTPHAPTLEFYARKTERIKLAKERFEVAYDSGQLSPYIVTSPHWTLFLEADELEELLVAHTRMTVARRDDDIRGRTPSV